MRIDRSSGKSWRVAPDVVQQRVAGLYSSSTGQERRQEPKLERREADFIIINPHPMSGGVDSKAAKADLGFGSTRFIDAPQDRFDAQEQLAHAEWLGHVVVSANFKANNPVDLVIFGGNHDDGNVFGGVFSPKLPANVGSGHIGEHKVEQNEIGLGLSTHGSQCALAVICAHGAPSFALQRELNRIHQVLLVVYDQNRCRHAGR